MVKRPMLPPLSELRARAAQVRLVLTDSDGVLTDAGVYYSAAGEELRRFSVRDGMGVERLRDAGIGTTIVTRETTQAVEQRARKLGIPALLGVRDKLDAVRQLLASQGLGWEQVAYIGDDVNDLEVLQHAGLSACPADAEPVVAGLVHVICERTGGHGAFREFADLILSLQSHTGPGRATPGGT
jgi:3-deoxy-D-manno-octulosonate 8-phosphate phosphatase (KDO 8-P phosphatase)